MGDREQLLQDLAEQVRHTGDEGRLFRTGEVATILRVSPRAVRSWAEEGMIDCVRTNGGHRLYPATAVLETLRRMGQTLDV